MKLYKIDLGGSWISSSYCIVEADSDVEAIAKAEKLYRQADEYVVVEITKPDWMEGAA